MLAALQHNAVLWFKAKTGLTVGFLIFLALASSAAVMVFIFLCVAAWAWASIMLGTVFGSLAIAGAFLLVGILAAAAGLLTRRQTQQRAILERAAQAQGALTLFTPGMLTVVKEAGQTFGWQLVIPLTLVGLLAVQQARRRDPTDDPFSVTDHGTGRLSALPSRCGSAQPASSVGSKSLPC